MAVRGVAYHPRYPLFASSSDDCEVLLLLPLPLLLLLPLPLLLLLPLLLPYSYPYFYSSEDCEVLPLTLTIIKITNITLSSERPSLASSFYECEVAVYACLRSHRCIAAITHKFYISTYLYNVWYSSMSDIRRSFNHYFRLLLLFLSYASPFYHLFITLLPPHSCS